MNIVRRNAPNPASLPVVPEGNPRGARNAERRDPFEAALLLRAEEQRVLFTPDVDLKETRDAYVFKADVPGIREDDLEVILAGNWLTLKGRREEERHEGNANYLASERSYGSFS